MPATTPVPAIPTPLDLAAVQVGKPVSSSHGQRLNRDLLFQLAYCVPPIFSGSFPNNSATTNAAHVGYVRSPNAQVLYVGVELWDATAGDHVNVTAALTGASAINPAILDGSTILYCPQPNHRDAQRYAQFLDVSGVTAGSITELSVGWSGIVGGKGFCLLHVAEVPLVDANAVQAATTEPGVTGAWPNPPNTLIDGGSTDFEGFIRLAYQAESARKDVHLHRQIATWETTTRALKVTGTSFVALTWPDIAGGFDPKLYTRARRLYETTTPEPTKMSVRYRADAGGTFRIDVNGTTTDLTLGATAGLFARSGTVTVSIPCNTSNQEVGPIIFKAKSASATNDDAHNVFISNIFLHSNEP
jgi:hypothetical protein